MKKEFQSRNKIFLRSAFVVAMFSVSFVLGACSSSYERGEDLVAADDMMEGPGVFSGDKGSFYIAGGKEKVAVSKPVSTMSAAETSKVLDNKIEQLKRDQIELETLKREINKKLKN